MENKDSNKTIKCNSCNAEVLLGKNFCTECGKPIEKVSEVDDNTDQNIVCPKCHAKLSAELRFCEECGTKIEHNNTSNQQTICSKCYADVPQGNSFCEECGTKTEVSHSSNLEIRCPKCYKKVENGETFCTECGTSLIVEKPASNANIKEELKKKRESSGRTVPPTDETLDSLVRSGKGLMKGLGGFLDKATSGIDKNINQSNKSSNKNVNEMYHARRENKIILPGFLVCDACGGYYELQPNESPDDFSDECECGGKLEHLSKLP